jgi:hypothetical protein
MAITSPALREHSAVSAASHVVIVRDPRLRASPPPIFVAHCSCGWTGVPRTGRNARVLAQADGAHHLELMKRETNDSR